MNILLLFLAAAGFALSLYAYITEENIKKNDQYKPACDINDRISCTKAFRSPYATMLGMSNGILGMLFYVVIFCADLLRFTMVVQLVVIAGFAATLFLAYLLYVKIKSFCLVCSTIYMINSALFLIIVKGYV